VNVVAILHSRAVAFSTRHRLQDQSVADCVRHCAVHRRRDTLGSDRQRTRRVRSTVLRGVGSFFSFNRTSGSCWRCNRVPGEGVNSSCNLGKADSAPLPPRFADTYASSTAGRNSLHRSHGLAKALRSGSRLVESFLTGQSCSQLPAIDCRQTADMASRPRSSARLPCADGAPCLAGCKRGGI
jgi:hypothetical protein